MWKPRKRKRHSGLCGLSLEIPKFRNLAMNGFAVLANKCAQKDANVSGQLAVHSHVRMRLGRVS